MIDNIRPKYPKSVARGAVIVVGMRWADRLIGITSTVILARLLAPEDFGILAMASLVLALVDALLDLGVNSALIQNASADRDDFNTAWTLRLIQASIAGSLIAFIGAPMAASYFNDHRVIDILYVMSLSVILGGFENIGIVTFVKNMEFGRDFRFFFLRRLIGFIVTISLALSLQNYWAMVIGAFVGRISGVGLSYLLHDFRPRLSLARFSNLWSYSQWMLVRNLGSYGAQQSDKVIVGRRSDAGTLGTYTLADEISAMPTSELLMPLGRVLFPAFVRVAHDQAELRRTFSLAFGVQTLIALPAGVGLALVANTATPLLLGRQWIAAIPFMQILSLISIATALTHGSSYLLMALGKVRLQAILTWLQLVSFLILALLIFPNTPALGIAKLRLFTSTIFMFILITLVLNAVPVLKVSDFIGASWRPAISTSFMTLVIATNPFLTDFPPALSLFFQIVVGAITYTASLFLLWWASGCANGAENYLLEKSGIKSKIEKYLN